MSVFMCLWWLISPHKCMAISVCIWWISSINPSMYYSIRPSLCASCSGHKYWWSSSLIPARVYIYIDIYIFFIVVTASNILDSLNMRSSFKSFFCFTFRPYMHGRFHLLCVFFILLNTLCLVLGFDLHLCLRVQS